jgi:hypothetical protein
MKKLAAQPEVFLSAKDLDRYQPGIQSRGCPKARTSALYAQY